MIVVWSLLLLEFVNLAFSASIHLDQNLCSFKVDDYSVQWAFEPQSRNVVFVLKQKTTKNNFWTGIGFGDRKKEFMDFIGVFVKNGQIGIADTHIDPSEGTLTPDKFTNVQSIAFDFSNGTLTAKFARSIDNLDDEFDHSIVGCQIFNFAVKGGAISRIGISPNFDEMVEKKVCDIEKNCLVDLRPQTETSNNSEVKNIEKLKKSQIAQSVDISGTKDPCSFEGVGYSVNWTYNPETEIVDFTMKHPIKQGKWWSAVGIGDTMQDMDIAIMFISSGRPKRIRDYFSSSYGVPKEDDQNDWILNRQRTKMVDEMIELGFSRKIETDDKENDRTMDGCVLFQFAANGGNYGTGYAVQKHDDWPDLYKACDLKKNCAIKGSMKRQEPELGENQDSKTEKVADGKNTGKNKNSNKKGGKNNKKGTTPTVEKSTTAEITNSFETTTIAEIVAETIPTLDVVSHSFETVNEVATVNVDSSTVSVTTAAVGNVLSEFIVISSTASVDDSSTTLSVGNDLPIFQSTKKLLQQSENVETSSGSENGFETTLSMSFSPNFISFQEPTSDTEMLPNIAASASSTVIANAESISSENSATSEASTTPVWTMPANFVPMVNGELNSSRIASNLTTATSENGSDTTIAGFIENDVTSSIPISDGVTGVNVNTASSEGSVDTTNSVFDGSSTLIPEGSNTRIGFSGSNEDSSSTVAGINLNTTQSVNENTGAVSGANVVPNSETTENPTTFKVATTDLSNNSGFTQNEILQNESSPKNPNNLPNSHLILPGTPETPSSTIVSGSSEIVSTSSEAGKRNGTSVEAFSGEVTTTVAITVIVIGGNSNEIPSNSSQIRGIFSEAENGTTTTQTDITTLVSTSSTPVEESLKTTETTITSSSSAKNGSSSTTAKIISGNVFGSFWDNLIGSKTTTVKVADSTESTVSESTTKSSTASVSDVIATTMTGNLFDSTSTASLSTTKTSEKTIPSFEFENSSQEVQKTTAASTLDFQTTPVPGPFTMKNTTESTKKPLENSIQGCGLDQEDFSLCQSYFRDYLGRVKTWASKNQEPFENQFGKACTLLKRVPNVPTYCCKIYAETCTGHIPL